MFCLQLLTKSLNPENIWLSTTFWTNLMKIHILTEIFYFYLAFLCSHTHRLFVIFLFGIVNTSMYVEFNVQTKEHPNKVLPLSVRLCVHSTTYWNTNTIAHYLYLETLYSNTIYIYSKCWYSKLNFQIKHLLASFNVWHSIPFSSKTKTGTCEYKYPEPFQM